jgi:hypothetical protein
VVYTILHVSTALRLIQHSGIRTTDTYCAELFPALKLLREGIVFWRAASVKGRRGGESKTRSYACCAFLDKTANGSEAYVYSQINTRGFTRGNDLIPIPAAINPYYILYLSI